MTREEAIAFGNRVISLGLNDDTQQFAELAVKALEQDPCDDAISRKAAIDAMIKIEQDDIGQYGSATLQWLAVRLAIEALNGLPSVTPQPKTGHWIRWYEQKEYDWGIDNIPHCKCSECGKEYDPHSSQFIKYCCECGVKMAESEE